MSGATGESRVFAPWTTPSWLVRAWLEQRITVWEAIELRPVAWMLGRPPLYGIRQGTERPPP